MILSFKDKLADFYKSNKKWINFSISLVWLSFLALILVYSWRSKDQLIPYLQSAQLGNLLMVMVYYLLALFLAVAGWAVIMGSFEKNISIWTHIRIYLVTLAARRIPGTIWYIGGRMLLYKKIGVSQVKTASASSVELIVSVIADCLIGALLLPFGLNLHQVYYLPLAIASLVGIFLIIPKNLAKFMNHINRPLPQKIKLWQPIMWVLMRCGLVIFGGLMIAQMLGVFYHLDENLILVVIGARAISGAASLLTYFLPSSFGVSDISLIALMTTIVPVSLATLLAVSIRILTTFFEVVFGGIFYIILRNSPDLQGGEKSV